MGLEWFSSQPLRGARHVPVLPPTPHHLSSKIRTTFHDWTRAQLDLAERVQLKYGPDQLWPPVISKDVHQGALRLPTGLYAQQVWLRMQGWLGEEGLGFG